MGLYAPPLAGWFRDYLTRGQLRTAIPNDQVSYFFEDFTDRSRWTAVGAGVGLGPKTLTGGVGGWALAGGGGGPSICNGDGVNYYTLTQANQRWYCAMRFRVPAGVAADTALYLGLVTGGFVDEYAVMGFRGAASVAKWYALVVNPPAALEGLQSTIDIDGNWHNAEMWCDGAGAPSYYFSVDGETPVALAAVNPPTGPVCAGIQAVAGAGGVTVDIDKALWVFGQAA